MDIIFKVEYTYLSVVSRQNRSPHREQLKQQQENLRTYDICVTIHDLLQYNL